MKSPWPYLAIAIAAFGCEAERPREPAPRPAPTREAPAVEDTSFRFPARERLVAIGDLHGDVAAARAALRLAGAIDDKDEWIGGKLGVVQTGDQLDRGDQEPELLELLGALETKAKQAGGALWVLDGNHEVMNVAGDFRYVTPAGFRRYAATPQVGATSPAVELLPEEQRGRARAFLPGGPEARRLAEHPIAIVVGDSVFVHGGVLPSHVRYGLGRINDEARRWMRGESSRLPESLNGENAPTWSREYSEGDPGETACNDLGNALDALHAKRMVVGHTPQKSGITSGCVERVWRIDVGLSRFYGGTPAVLEIKDGRARALTAEPAIRDAGRAGAGGGTTGSRSKE